MTKLAKKFSPALLAGILADISLGMSIESASARAGINHKTLRLWIAENEDIASQVASARADLERQYISVLHDVALGPDTKLAVPTTKYLLEHMNPSEWGSISRNDAYTRDQRVRELVEQLQREGLSVTVEEIEKELAQVEGKTTKALPSGKK